MLPGSTTKKTLLMWSYELDAHARPRISRNPTRWCQPCARGASMISIAQQISWQSLTTAARQLAALWHKSCARNMSLFGRTQMFESFKSRALMRYQSFDCLLVRDFVIFFTQALSTGK